MRKALHHLKTADPIMDRIIEAVGPYRITYRAPEFESLVRSIVYQQLSGKAAGTIFGRLHAAAASRAGKITPSGILKLGPEAMRPLGLSGQKARYVTDLAEKTVSRQIQFSKLAGMADTEVIEHLTEVKGVGVWTVHMFLIFALERPDVLPTGDLGVRTAIKKAYNLEQLPGVAEMERIAEPWSPYRSVASWYLWRTLDGEAAM